MKVKRLLMQPIVDTKIEGKEKSKDIYSRIIGKTSTTEVQNPPTEGDMAVVRVKPRTDSVISINSLHFDKTKDNRGNLLGYFFALMVILTYTVAVVSAQLAVESTPRFQISTMRYATQVVVTLSTIGICRKSLRIKLNKIWMVGVISVFDFAYNFSFYHAASYLPVGNMEGMFTALTIVILGLYDVSRKKCAINHVVSGVICASGLVLLVQPWKIPNEVKIANTKTIPCEAFGFSEDVSTVALQNFTSLSNITHRLELTTIFPGTMDNTSVFQVNSTIIDSLTNITNNTNDAIPTNNYVNDEWIGYVLISCASICISIISVFIEKLTTDYHPAVVSFWIASTDSIVSAILMFSLETPLLPEGTYCILFTFLLTTLSALNAFFSHITLSYLLPSQTALALSLSMVVLFIVQNTLLADVKPGRQNIEEILGAVVTFAGAIISPVFLLGSRLCKKEQMYTFEQK